MQALKHLPGRRDQAALFGHTNHRRSASHLQTKLLRDRSPGTLIHQQQCWHGLRQRNANAGRFTLIQVRQFRPRWRGGCKFEPTRLLSRKNRDVYKRQTPGGLTQWEALALMRQPFVHSFLPATQREALLKASDAALYSQLSSLPK